MHILKQKNPASSCRKAGRHDENDDRKSQSLFVIRKSGESEKGGSEVESSDLKREDIVMLKWVNCCVTQLGYPNFDFINQEDSEDEEYINGISSSRKDISPRIYSRCSPAAAISQCKYSGINRNWVIIRKQSHRFSYFFK